MSKLSVYHDRKAEVWVVAESKDHAATIILENGYYDGDDETIDDDDIVELKDDEELIVIDDTDAETVEECGRIVKTCREWCESNGPGFLCAADY